MRLHEHVPLKSFFSGYNSLKTEQFKEYGQHQRKRILTIIMGDYRKQCLTNNAKLLFDTQKVLGTTYRQVQSQNN